MQFLTIATLLFTGAFATFDIAAEFESAANAASTFGDCVKNGAFDSSYSVNYHEQFQNFYDTLNTLCDNYKTLPNDCVLDDAFNDRLADFEGKIYDVVDCLNNYGSTIGGYEQVSSWCTQISYIHTEIFDQFQRTADCGNFDFILPYFNNVGDCFGSISSGWGFENPWYDVSYQWWNSVSCSAPTEKITSAIVTPKPTSTAGKHSSTAMAITTQAVSSKKVVTSVAPSSAHGVTTKASVSSQAVTAKPASSQAATTKPASSQAATTKPASSQAATTKPASSQAATTKPASSQGTASSEQPKISTHVDSSTTYRCKVVAPTHA